MNDVSSKSFANKFENSTADFYIEVDFEKGQGNPSRAFRAMSDLIQALEMVDSSLIKSIDSKIEPILLLEDVETGSIRAWLKQGIKSIQENSPKNMGWEPAVEDYLIKGKYAFIDFLKGETSLTNQKIEALENDLLHLAEQTEVNKIPAYDPISREGLVNDIKSICDALTPLDGKDKASFVTKEGEVPFNLSLRISPDSIEELITSEKIENTSIMIMKIKKPDFLGEAQWEFKYDGRSIPAKISDVIWLRDYQDGKVTLSPGDAIRAEVKATAHYGFDREVVARSFVVIKVLEIIPKDTIRQISFRSITMD